MNRADRRRIKRDARRRQRAWLHAVLADDRFDDDTKRVARVIAARADVDDTFTTDELTTGRGGAR